MAQLLAPYHNGMRLGQGFNSYNQQICLDNAVLIDNKENRERVRPYYIPDDDPNRKVTALTFLPKLEKVTDHLAADSQSLVAGDDQRPKLQPWVKPQIVTYSSRFVDKLQDVTESMNISGALSIQTATVGGKGSGSYVDSDKFKSSDINFHLQVKVTNQIHKPEEYKLFNKIHNMLQTDFTAVYGDCFISGFEEGGEFNAIVSMKVTDKSKIYKIKADLEANIKGGVSAEAKVSGEINKESTDKSTETTIAVNWSGGGSIKGPEEPWTIATMTKAAAAFPDLVAMTPQRTYAILTKYTAIESFQRQIEHYSILDYENASIYTNMLMDHFMEYKMMWKQLSQAAYELQRGTAKIDNSEASEQMLELAVIRPLPDKDIGSKLLRSLPAAVAGRQGTEGTAANETPPGDTVVTESVRMAKATGATPLQGPNNTILLQYNPFAPDLAGLISARKVCRNEMAKIVNEVDLITKNPKLALDTTRDELFLEPAVYRQLLPVVRTWTDDMLPDTRLIEAPVILGYSAPPDSSKLLPDILTLATKPQVDVPNRDLQTSLDKVGRKAKNYRMVGLAGAVKQDPPVSLRFFNDLETLDPTYRLTLLAIWSEDKIVQGIQVTYANGEKKGHGWCDESRKCNWIKLNQNEDGSEILFEMQFSTATIKTKLGTKDPVAETVISAIKVVTSKYRVLNTGEDTPQNFPTADGPVKVEDTPTPGGPTGVTLPPPPTPPPPPPEDESIVDVASIAQSATTITLSRPDVGPWSVRGMFGFAIGKKSNTRFFALGTVFGRDKFVPRPRYNELLPICKTYLPSVDSSLSDTVKALQDDIKNTYLVRKQYAGYFILGELSIAQKPTETFNHISTLAFGVKIKDVVFATKGGKLTGMKTTWTNGLYKVNGTMGDGDSSFSKWTCVVHPYLLLSAKITKVNGDDSKPRIQTVEFIRSEDTKGIGSLPTWLLSVSTLRYIGDGAAHTAVEKDVVETAPNHDNAVWSVRGFYGGLDGDKTIVSLGVIWGRDK